MSVAGLLIIVGEPYREAHVEHILGRVSDGIQGWNHDKAALNLDTELFNFINRSATPKQVEDGLHLGDSNGALHIQVLLGQKLTIVEQSLYNFLCQPGTYKHIVHAGCVGEVSGNWFLRDAQFTANGFADLLSKAAASYDPQQQIAISLSCLQEGDWKAETKDTKFPAPPNVSLEIFGRKDGAGGSPSVSAFAGHLAQFLISGPLAVRDLMPTTKAVGTIKFPRPTFYIFPAGDGDTTLFGITGFAFLLDGGFGRKPPSWDLVRHLERVDAFLFSNLSPATITSSAAFLRRNVELGPTACPQLGCVFANLPPHVAPQNGQNPLIVSLFPSLSGISDDLSCSNLKAHPVYATMSAAKKPEDKRLESTILYQKVGHGKLSMYPLNPQKDSKEVSEFQDRWKKLDAKVSVSDGGQLSLTSRNSAAVFVLWQPADVTDLPTRFLYPGGCPQDKILAALEKLRSNDFMKIPFKEGPNPSIKPVTVPGPLSPLETDPMNLSAPLQKPSPEIAVPQPEITVPSPVAQQPSPIQKQPSPISPLTPPTAPETGSEPLVDFLPPAANHMEKPTELNPPPQPQPPSPAERGIMEESNPFLASLGIQSPPLMSPDSPNGPPVNVEQQDLSSSAPGIVDMSPAEQSMLPAVPEEQPILQPPEMPKEVIEDIAPLAAVAPSPLEEVPSPDVRPTEEVAVNPFDESATPAAAPPADRLPESDFSYGTSDIPLQQPLTPIDPFGDQDLLPGHGPGSPIAAAQQVIIGGSPIAPDPFQTDVPFVPSDAELTSPPLDFNKEPTESKRRPPSVSFEDSLMSSYPLVENPTDPMTQPSWSPNPTSSHSENMSPFGDSPGNVSTQAILDPMSNSQKGNETNHAMPDMVASGTASEVRMDPDTALGGHDGVPPPVMHNDKANSSPSIPTVEALQRDLGPPLSLPPPAAKSAPGAKKPTDATRRPGSASASSASRPTRPGDKKVTRATQAQAPAAKSSSATSSVERKPAPTPSTRTAKPDAAKPGASAAIRGVKPDAAKKAEAAKKTPGAAGPRGTKLTATAQRAPVANRAPPPTKSTGAARRPSGPTKTAPAKKPPLSAPVYMDLCYIPTDATQDFFMLVRSRNYVMSCVRPRVELLEGLLKAKKEWKQPLLPVDLIPTYDSDVLHLWMAMNRDEMERECINVSPSAARCTVSLEDDQGTCAAYRLEL